MYVPMAEEQNGSMGYVLTPNTVRLFNEGIYAIGLLLKSRWRYRIELQQVKGFSDGC